MVSDAKSTSTSMIGLAARFGNLSAADVLYGRRHAAWGIGDWFAEALKKVGPDGVVVQDDDGIRRSQMKLIDA